MRCAIYLKLPREISQIACIFTFQWVRFSFSGNFEKKIFLLLFCKKKFMCMKIFVYVFYDFYDFCQFHFFLINVFEFYDSCFVSFITTSFFEL